MQLFKKHTLNYVFFGKKAKNITKKNVSKFYLLWPIRQYFSDFVYLITDFCKALLLLKICVLEKLISLKGREGGGGVKKL